MDNANNDDEVNPIATTSEAEFRNDEDTTALSLNTAESLEKENQKNPLLLSPVIRSVFQFLNIKDMKNCRFVCREWGSNGKIALGSCAIIRFTADGYGRRPVDFRSRFLNSTAVFRVFMVSGDVTPSGFEELGKFFGEHEKYVKELILNVGYSNDTPVKNIEISSWISKSPMVQKDAKYLTRLSLGNIGYGSRMVAPPLHLIGHIKELTVSNCRIDLEDGIQICSKKLKLSGTPIFLEGDTLTSVRINDIVDLNKTKDVSLHSSGSTKYILDLSGHATMENVILEGVQILNGKISEWEIEQLAMTNIPYTLNSQMNIKDLSLCNSRDEIDLATLPNSIQKLSLYIAGRGSPLIRCSQPIAFENLQYLHIVGAGGNSHTSPSRIYCSFLSNFMNCPQLTDLKFNRCNKIEVKSLWMPKTVKTLTLRYSIINWLDDESSLNLEKLVFYGCCTFAQEQCKINIKVDDFVVHYWEMAVDKDLVAFLEYRKICNFGKRIYVGKLRWGTGKLEDSVLNKYVDSKSLFYVFENEEKGRALSETEFLDLIPKHLDVPPL